MYSVDIKDVFKNDPKAILSFRESAKSKVDSLVFPNIGKLNKKNFLPESTNLQTVLLSKVKSIPAELSNLVSDADSNVIVIQDGNIIYDSLTGNYNDVYVNDFHSAFEERPELIVDLLSRPHEKQDNQMVALNSAYFNSGVVIDIPKNLELKENLVVVYLQKHGDVVHRSLIHTNPNSSLTLTEYFLNSTSCYANLVTDIIMEDGSRVVYSGIDQYDSSSRIYQNTRATMMKATDLHLLKIYLSEANTVGDIDVLLLGEGGVSNVETVAVARNNQQVGLNINTNNAAKRTSAQINNHGVAHDKAKLLFNAIGKVEKGCVGSNAYQKTRGIILSDQAEINANPYLIIDEYDVEGAGHAATIGRFNEEDIHYMMSRGVPRGQAETMVINGFIKPVVEEIPNQKMVDYVYGVLKEKLGTK